MLIEFRQDKSTDIVFPMLMPADMELRESTLASERPSTAFRMSKEAQLRHRQA
jgi:hypothetical protein